MPLNNKLIQPFVPHLGMSYSTQFELICCIISSMFEGTSEQLRYVEDLANDAYKHVADNSPEAQVFLKYRLPIHRGPFCILVSDYMIDRLRENNIPALPRDYFGMLRHRHISLGNGWIADATWQQRFQDSKVNTLRRLWYFKTTQVPRVLITRISNLPSLLTKYGVSSHAMKTWTEAEIRNLGSELYPEFQKK